MTSYVPVKLGDETVPIKFGGYEGKDEHVTPAGDVRHADRAWVPKEYAKHLRGKKYLTVKVGGKWVRLPIEKVTNWSGGSKVVQFHGRPLEEYTLHQAQLSVNVGRRLQLQAMGIASYHDYDRRLRQARQKNAMLPKESRWYEVSKRFDMGILDMDNFAGEMGFRSFEEMEIEISPKTLFKKGEKPFIAALQKTSQKASEMEWGDVWQGMAKVPRARGIEMKASGYHGNNVSEEITKHLESMTKDEVMEYLEMEGTVQPFMEQLPMSPTDQDWVDTFEAVWDDWTDEGLQALLANRERHLEKTRMVNKRMSRLMSSGMGKGRGWYGQPKRHSKAAKLGHRRRR